MLVIDASITLAWLLPEESTPTSEAVLRHVLQHHAWVPALWSLEVGNALVMAVRRKRISSHQFETAFGLLRDLPIRVSSHAPETDFGMVVSLAQRHQLTTYDAAYLEVAIRSALPLATVDSALARAATEHGLVFSA